MFLCPPLNKQATSSPSNFQLIVVALADYAKLTGIDISNSSFARRLELSNSPQAILDLFEEREKAFEEYRDRNQRLIGCISPAVEVFYAISGTLGEVVGSGPLSASKRCFCRDGSSPRCMSLKRPSTNSPMTHVYSRLPLESRQAMTLLWIYLNA